MISSATALLNSLSNLLLKPMASPPLSFLPVILTIILSSYKRAVQAT
jgi:hypothetical protein